MVCCSCATTPKSASLTPPRASSSTLAALMSRWITLRSTCMYSSARRTPRQMPATHGSSKPRPTLRITSRVEPASQNSITTQSVDRIWYSRTKASLYATMCSQSQLRRMRISFLMSSQVAGSSESTLTATSSPPHSPTYTDPLAPVPMCRRSLVSTRARARGEPSAALARLARWFGLSWRGEVPDDVVARGDSVIGSNWEGGPLSGSGLGVPEASKSAGWRYGLTGCLAGGGAPPPPICSSKLAGASPRADRGVDPPEEMTSADWRRLPPRAESRELSRGLRSPAK
mmetsp:Transcript_1960/g.5485  ORF Transcript_1960/g.5485 Transcript_1960/m.5485 type:complete len:286 (+) Transcript_1960:714-1571(+)